MAGQIISDLGRTSFLLALSGIALALGTAFAPFTAIAQTGETDSELQGYDSIVQDLKREVDRPAANAIRARAPTRSPDPFENVWIHGGVGLSTVMQDINFDDGSHFFFGGKGVQAALGIDLFSEHWMAEGTVRSFGENDDQRTRVSLKEFELKFFYKDRLSRQLGFRLGGGLSARYLTVRRPGFGPTEYSTPASVATGGFDIYMNDRLSLGFEISARNSMVADTIDRTAYDGTFRVDAHF